jgi:hypothetical protein
MRLESLEKLQGLGDLNFWTKDMIYPYTHKFLHWDDIKDCFTGFARIIEFKCFSKDINGEFDPTVFGANKLK